MSSRAIYSDAGKKPFSGTDRTRRNAPSSSTPKKQFPSPPPPTAGPTGPTGKRLVPPPTSIGNFGVILLIHLCKRIILIETLTKLCLYFCVLVVVSTVTDRYPLPRSYLSNKQNFLNQYFVKIGWGWTCTLLGLFIFLTSNVYCCADRRSINRHLLRLAFSTFWWFLCTKLFAFIEGSFGLCVTNAALGYDDCESTGNRWVPFDVSGHAFLLVHCLLTISEEVRCINGWERIGEILDKEKAEPVMRLTEEELARTRTSYDTNLRYVRCVVVALTALTLLWELMLLVTIAYFHNLAQKLVGASFAAAGWFISYRVWYRVAAWSPGLPGQGRLRYMKEN